ncbi:STY1053 family phage-associated protein [Herbaspirillum robiniae]|uniref:STY1053 family phage-associated protein n=1 Tax=Herbaspirillum robiniae TaxID=2014887 RepID=UPI0009A2173C|nr:hypothetical protein [Herbaspirillum robiniae]
MDNKKQTIHVHKAFKLLHNGEHLQFAPGSYSVDAEVAGHWFTKAHVGEAPLVDAGTAAAAEELMAELGQREKELRDQADLLQKAQEALAEREKAVQASEATAKQVSAELDSREASLAEREKAVAVAEAAAAKTTKK